MKSAALGAEGAVAGGNIGRTSGQNRRLVSICDCLTGRIAVRVVKAQSVLVADEHHIQVGRISAQGVQIPAKGLRGISHLKHISYLGHGGDVGSGSADGGIYLLSLPGNIIIHGNAQREQQENCGDGEKTAGEGSLQRRLFFLFAGTAVSSPDRIFYSEKI